MKALGIRYLLTRHEGENPERTITRGGDLVDPRLDLVNHSPDGFSWGYFGSGPAQASLAILADFLEDDQAAMELYQRFKRHKIGRLPIDENAKITGYEIETWVGRQMKSDPFSGEFECPREECRGCTGNSLDAQSSEFAGAILAGYEMFDKDAPKARNRPAVAFGVVLAASYLMDSVRNQSAFCEEPNPEWEALKLEIPDWLEDAPRMLEDLADLGSLLKAVAEAALAKEEGAVS